MARILDATHATIEAVEISALRDNAFYATVRLEVGDSVQEVDARPSDALPLAVRVDAPVFVAEDVMEKTGIPLPEDHTPNGKGVQAIIDQLEAEFAARAEARAAASTEETESTDWETRARAILADAFE
jgi:hypothetical protein